MSEEMPRWGCPEKSNEQKRRENALDQWDTGRITYSRHCKLVIERVVDRMAKTEVKYFNDHMEMVDWMRDEGVLIEDCTQLWAQTVEVRETVWKRRAP